LQLIESDAWQAYHYIRKQHGTLVLLSGQSTKIGEHLHESEIKMCERGLHASLCRKDARHYAPSNSVLTRVLIWGNMQLHKDKVVATDRKIIEIMD
jgi:hypothetical protein